MTSKTHLVIGDSHAHYQHDNKRAEYLGRLILDIKPDVVVHIGDSADMPSLSGYDRGKKTFQGRTYLADINSHLDFNDRTWNCVRSAKKRLPHRVFLEGNHENRIKKAVNLQPELEGAISFDDLKLNEYYDEVIEYETSTPGLYQIDGITYAHYLISGIAGRAISGEHLGYSLLTKRFGTSVVGHNHLLDFCQRSDNFSKIRIGLSVGCYQDYQSDWAGKANDLWWRGICVLRNVSDGSFDLQCISLDAIIKEYS